MSRERTVLLVNARSRRGEEEFEEARRALAACGVAVDAAHALHEPDELPARIRDELGRGAKRVVVGGGDGSLSCAAGVLAGSGAALGVLPLGTANDFARSLRIPAELEGAARVLARGATREVDLAFAGSRPFLNAASFGVSSELTRLLDAGLKRRAGKLAYPVAGAVAATSQEPFRVTLALDGRTVTLDALQVVIGNGRYHGGGRLVSPRARLDDRRLVVYALAAASEARETRAPDRLRDLASLARYAYLLLRGRHLDHPDVFHAEARTVVARTEPPLEIDADGELAGHTPAEFRIRPGALTVIAPPPRRRLARAFPARLRPRARAVPTDPVRR
jgi:YegS/Rv2252/BmrU family lipid kinase